MQVLLNKDYRIWVCTGLGIGAIGIASYLYLTSTPGKERSPKSRQPPTHIQGKLRDTSTLGDNWNISITSSTMDRFVGCILGVVCGDMLGADLEGENPRIIKETIDEVHSFSKGRRRYTDDTEMTLALMKSIIKKNYLSASDCSKVYGSHFLQRPSRGYGRSAQKVLRALGTNSTNHLTSGKLDMEEGSWGNGGAMRISPVGLCFRNADLSIVKKAVKAAVMCTHCHPVGIDGSLAQANLVIYSITRDSIEEFNVDEMFEHVLNACETEEVKKKLKYAQNHVKLGTDDIEFIEGLSDKKSRNGAVFQIVASDAVSCVAFILAKYYATPEKAIIKAVGLGGDTDTIASMVGACVGALHGTKWIPRRWFKHVENASTLIPMATILSTFNFTSETDVVIEGLEEKI